MSCPNCKEDFDIEEQNSPYQVNDFTQLTYCSSECSALHMLTSEGIKEMVKLTGVTDSKADIIESITAENCDTLTDEQVDDIAEKILSAVHETA